VLAVNQKGSHGREFFSNGEQRVWVADSPDSGARYLGVFNLGERDQDIRIQWPELGLPQDCVLRDLWDRKDLGQLRAGHTFRVAPHASGLYKLTPVR
jgi:alpha-galactosidase